MIIWLARGKKDQELVPLYIPPYTGREVSVTGAAGYKVCQVQGSKRYLMYVIRQCTFSHTGNRLQQSRRVPA